MAFIEEGPVFFLVELVPGSYWAKEWLAKKTKGIIK
jgi:hypothetical protein